MESLQKSAINVFLSIYDLEQAIHLIEVVDFPAKYPFFINHNACS